MVRLDEGGAAAAEVRCFAPPLSLRPWVQDVSIQPGPARRAAGWRVVPDTCGHLILTVTRGGPLRVRLVGARSVYADIDVSDRAYTAAVRLHPGVLPALLRDDARVLTDGVADVRDVFGADGSRLLERLAGVDAPAAAATLLQFVEQHVSRQLSPGPPQWLARAGSVRDAAAVLGLSARAVHRHALETIGLPPKRALRVERLLGALAHIAAGRAIAVAADAARYSDQAHFTRECRALLGETPAAWLRRGHRMGRADSFKTDE
jgi:AraC-like DNA-binding protein